MKPAPRRRAFTRVDLLAVILVLLTVVGLLQAQLSRVRESDARSTCQDNLHNICDAIHNYASGHGELFPPLLDYSPGENIYWKPFWFELCPDLEQAALYKRAMGGGGGWAQGNHQVVLRVLLCPSDPSSSNGLCTSGARNWAGTSYAPVYQQFGGVTVYDPVKERFITKAKYTNVNVTFGKGHSNQVGVVERFTSFPKYGWSNATFYPMSEMYWGVNAYGSAYGAWGLFPPQTKMLANAAHPHYPNSAHTVAQTMMMDGAIRQISSTVDARTWKDACDPDVFLVAPNDW